MNRIFEKKSRNLPMSSIQYMRIHFGIYALVLLSPVIGKSAYDYFTTQINYKFLGLGILAILAKYTIANTIIGRGLQLNKLQRYKAILAFRCIFSLSKLS